MIQDRRSASRHRRLPTILALVAALGVLAAGTAGPDRRIQGRPDQQIEIHVLSNRADLISGGDALVEVVLPSGARAEALRVMLDGRDVSERFARRSNGRVLGIVEGLKIGPNTLRARVPRGGRTRVTITSHPIGGPVFSGPQVQPWTCQETAVDQQCNQPPEFEFRYRTSDGEWQPYDPANPPPDEEVARTTTDEGVTVPFIVRFETGYQDRSQYKIAVLFDPDEPWKPWAPQRQWNHKLMVTHGSGCGAHYQTFEAPSVTAFGGTTALGRGFAVLSTDLANAGHNCNVVTQAESLMMAKEHLVERYGLIRYTIGTGCSGGSLTQQQVANAYPGIYQGIIPQCSFPDAWTTATQVMDYHLLRLYLENPTRWGLGVVWTPADIAAVEDHPNHANAVEFDELFWTSFFDPSSNQLTTTGLISGCLGVSPEQTYDPETNPGGVRCTLADYMINVFGPRQQQVWSAPERQIGHGFAGLPLDNVGVQYGLDALQRGQITPRQFVDLNTRIGGVDIDANLTQQRLQADQPALANSYRTGAVNTASNLDQVAIIDVRGPDRGTFHDAYRAWAVRARLQREQGHHRNHVIWFGVMPQSDHSFSTQALLAMDGWLAAVEADLGDTPLATKIVRNRPDTLEDRCAQRPWIEQVEVPGIGQVCNLKHVQTRYGTPRTAAGAGIETDNQKCRLEPLRRSDYYPVQFTDEQWERLNQAFPTGVCDWSTPGISHTDTIPWLTYQNTAGDVIYGGRPLGPAPTHSGGGWTSAAFSSWLLP